MEAWRKLKRGDRVTVATPVGSDHTWRYIGGGVLQDFTQPAGYAVVKFDAHGTPVLLHPESLALEGEVES